VIGFAQLLELGREPPPADTQRCHVKLIHEAGEHLRHMISDRLDLTSIEAGHVALQWQAVDLALPGDECLAQVQAQAASAGVSLANGLRAVSRISAARMPGARSKARASTWRCRIRWSN
jgi:two-component system cell cycle sensor histidine kinase PleC